MRVDDDQALTVLAENPPQHDFGNNTGIDQIPQHAAWPHRRQLVDIADENQVAMGIDGAQQMIHQGQVDHRSLIDDDKIDLQRIIFAALKAALARVVFEQPVDGRRFFAGAFGHAFCRPPCWRRQREVGFGAAQDREQRRQQSGFPRARARR